MTKSITKSMTKSMTKTMTKSMIIKLFPTSLNKSFSLNSIQFLFYYLESIP